LHDVHTILNCFFLRRLETSPTISSSIQLIHIRLAGLVSLSVILPIVIEVKDLAVTGNSNHVPFDPCEQFPDLFRVAGNVETFDVAFDNDSNFVKLSAKMIPVKKTCLWGGLLFEHIW
jgi:hypothetical protein